jgi:hypothetical protein
MFVDGNFEGGGGVWRDLSQLVGRNCVHTYKREILSKLTVCGVCSIRSTDSIKQTTSFLCTIPGGEIQYVGNRTAENTRQRKESKKKKTAKRQQQDGAAKWNIMEQESIHPDMEVCYRKTRLKSRRASRRLPSLSSDSIHMFPYGPQPPLS